MAGERGGWWHTVLGEYPTGIALITSLASDGEPIGMIVGTFTAVSEEPPMIGFLPVRTSRTLPQLLAHGRFAVSVLGSRHEEFCRDFLMNEATRFQTGDWELTPQGLHRLEGAVAWFDATIAQVHEVGDHEIVVGDVSDFGIGSGHDLPLLFLKGGYGTFSVAAQQPDFLEFSDRLRLADGMNALLTELADACGVSCALATVVGGSVVLLDSSITPGDGTLPSMPRASFPFAAPMAPALAAWGPESHQRVWIEQSRHLLGRVDRPRLASLLDDVRTRGYSMSLGGAIWQFDSVIGDPAANRRALAELWAEIEEDRRRIGTSDDWYAEVHSIQVPVFGADGSVVLELVVEGFAPGTTRERFEAVVAESKATAARLSQLISSGS